MTRVRALGLLSLGLAAAAPARAQDVPVTRPGGVVTLVWTVPQRAGEDSVEFELEPSDGVRAFSRTRGVVSTVDTSHLPFTLGLPPNAPAGTWTAARVHLHWRGGAVREQHELRAEVAARPAISFRIGADTVTVSPGEPLELAWRLRNRGNTSDSFDIAVSAPLDWARRSSPERVWLEPGDTAAGTVVLIPPTRAPRGVEHVIRMEADAERVSEAAAVVVFVVGDDGWLGEFAHVPGEVFIGSSTGDPSPALALSAAGELVPGTRVDLVLRHSDALNGPPAFSAAMAGPRLRLGIESEDWHVRLGDVFVPGDVFLGTLGQGRGVSAGMTRGGWSGAFMAAHSAAVGPLAGDGHAVQAEVTRETGYGSFGATGASVARDGHPWRSYSAIGGGLTYGLQRAGHELGFEVGWQSVRTRSDGNEGLAARARYGFRWEGGSVDARFRTTPGSTLQTTSHGDEAFVSAAVDISPGMKATGWAYATSAPLISGDPHPASRGAAGGLRFRLPRKAEGQLVGRYQSNERVGSGLPGTVSRSIRGALDVPLGAVTVESDLELGTTSTDRTRGFTHARAGLRWTHRRQWASVGLARHDTGDGPAAVAANVAGALIVRSLRLQGGVSLRVDGTPLAEAVSLWSGTVVSIPGDVDLTIGLDYRSTATTTDAWRIALGVTRRFGMPLPFKRPVALEGVVFEDLDGDHARDANEPAIPDLGMSLGPLRTTTDEAGRFRFTDGGGGTLRIDALALGSGMAVPADAHLPSTGRIEVPVIRAASLALDIFLDRDGDHQRDEVEEAAAGAVVLITDTRGRTLQAATDEAGELRFGRLAPGEYVVWVYRETGRPGARPLELRISLPPGGAVQQTVALPRRQREIRIEGGRELRPNPGIEPSR